MDRAPTIAGRFKAQDHCLAKDSVYDNSERQSY